jgi:hypothetical protein
MLKAAIGLGLSVGLLVAAAAPALAAIDATLSTTAARPGESVVLASDDHGHPYAYGDLAASGPESVYLVSASDLDKEIARYGFQRCPAPEQHYLGKLTWVGDSGTLSFKVPNVSSGDYYFELLVPYSSPQCWRVGGGSGPLVLAVRATTAPAAVQSHAGMSLWVVAIIAAVGGLVVVYGAVALTRRGARS